MSSNLQWTEEIWNNTVAALMRRAATDRAFRQKSLSDPRGAVKEIAGIEMHPNARVRFVERTEGLVLTLPPLRDGELSDAALENVAGGDLTVCIF